MINSRQSQTRQSAKEKNELQSDKVIFNEEEQELIQHESIELG